MGYPVLSYFFVTGKSSFSGASFHTAQWPKDYDVAGKNVAVIGTGASAVQIIPQIADRVKTLTVFQRTPAWVPHRHNWQFPQFLKEGCKGNKHKNECMNFIF